MVENPNFSINQGALLPLEVLKGNKWLLTQIKNILEKFPKCTDLVAASVGKIEKESFLNSLLLNFSKTQVANKILPLNKNKYKLIDKFITSVKKMNETVVQFVVYSELYKNALKTVKH